MQRMEHVLDAERPGDKICLEAVRLMSMAKDDIDPKSNGTNACTK